MLPGLRVEASSPRNAKKYTIRAAISFLRGLPRAPELPRIARTFLLKALDRSDYKRWNNAENLHAWWETRTQAIAALVPKGARVINSGPAGGGSNAISIRAVHTLPQTLSIVGQERSYAT